MGNDLRDLSCKNGFESGYSTLDEWTLAEAVPFAIESPVALNQAIDEALTRIGGLVRLLGLGEALHGNRDLLLLRNRLFFRLVEKHGFSAIAIESSFTRGRLVDEYIAGRGPATYENLQEEGFSHGFGHLDANRELVEWMKDYNSDPSHALKLHFYGFDSPTEMMGSDSPGQLLHFVLDYLDSIDHHAALAKESDQRVSRLLGIRDAMMAENLAYIASRESSRGRVLAFAHNRHLQRGRAEWQYLNDHYSWWPAGSHLHELLGPGYAAIGTGVGISESNDISRPEGSTLEALLTASPGPARLIPTGKGQGLPAKEIASLPSRSGSTKLKK